MNTLTVAAVLAVLRTLPVFHEDRALVDEKRAQLETFSVAIVETANATPRWPWGALDLASFQIAVANHETHWSLRLHSGHCKPWECDRGRARGPWQQQRSSVVSDEVWDSLVGRDLDSTRIAAASSARALTRSRWLCRSFEAHGGHGWIDRVFSAYAGRGCSGSLPDVAARRATYLRVRARLAAWRPETS